MTNQPPRQPLASLPDRRPGSVRRTVQVDIAPPDGRTVTDPRLYRKSTAAADDGPSTVVTGAARDLRTDGDGTTVVDQATVEAWFDSSRHVTRLISDPPSPWSAPMLGQRAGGGFRRALAEFVPPDAATSLVRQIIDDLPVAVLISGYSWIRLARLAGHDARKLTSPSLLPLMTDICSGWRDGGTAVESVRRGDGAPLQDCPPATDLGSGDPLAWHAMPTLGADWMRRRRCIDVSPQPDGSTEIWAMFRDTVAAPDGSEEVLHEYSLSMSVVPTESGGTAIASAHAVPHVLPFVECPAAAASVEALIGAGVDAVPGLVSDVINGIGSCTHLNDLLRSIGGISVLVAGGQTSGRAGGGRAA